MNQSGHHRRVSKEISEIHSEKKPSMRNQATSFNQEIIEAARLADRASIRSAGIQVTN